MIERSNVLRRAELLASLGRYDDVDSLVAQLLAADPEDEAALVLLGRGQVARNRFDEASATGRRLLGAHPDSMRGLILLARCEQSLRRPEEGVLYARRAVELYPDNVVCLVVLADVLRLVTPGSAEALALIERAIAVDPEYAAAYLTAGKIYIDVRQYAEAERWTLQALRIRPDNRDAILLLGLARAGLGRFDESRDAVLAALRMDAQPDTISRVIEHVERRGIPDHLVEIYQMALTARGTPDLTVPGAAGEDPALIAAQGKLARRMYSQHTSTQGRSKAGELADAVLAVDPGNSDARYVRSRRLNDVGRYAEALALAEQLCTEKYPSADVALLNPQLRMKKYSAALRTLRRVRSEAADRLVAEAWCLRNLGQHEEALRVANLAAERHPVGRAVQVELGLAAKATGNVELAEQAFRTAIDQAPDHGEAAAYLAVLLTETDRWAEAESLMATLTPDRPDVLQMAVPCAMLLVACRRAALPSHKMLDAADRSPELLDDVAHWMNLKCAMFAVIAATQRHPKIVAQFTRELAVLRRIVDVPANSALAWAVQRFAALLAIERIP